MPQFGILLLVNVFSALLPPIDPDEPTYYDILNVNKNASPEEIRKAYKKISLKLHPDKVAQRQDVNAEEAAAEYEKVQEAYGVIANDEKRKTYNALGDSPTRYKFFAQGAMANPGALYENLTAASFVDKTRLVGVVTIIIMLLLTQPILICSKINQDLESQGGGLQDTSWFVIFIPYWIIGGLFMIFTAVLLPFIPTNDRLPMGLSFLEQFFWYLSLIFLCLRWDGTWTNPYRQVLAPVYVAMVLRWTQAVFTLRKVRNDVQKMVTVDYLEKEVLKGKSLDDLEEQELKDIQQNFMVVTVPPDFEPYSEEGVDLDDEKIEEQKVEASPEFEAATEIYNKIFGGLSCSVVFISIFLILLTRKLDGFISASWWVVFIPIFIERGCRWLLNFYLCICGKVLGDEIIVHMKNTSGSEDAHDAGSSEKVGKGDANNNEAGQVEGQKNDDTKKSQKLPNTTGDHENEKQSETEQEQATSGTNKENARSEKISSESNEAKEESKQDNPKEEESSNIHIDEETFRAWQSAYEQAEENAMQEQAKASSECCNLTFQIILLCLVVAKIEKNFDNDDPNDTGFNMFWILFPFFLFFGVVCCCCTLLIYGAAPGSAADYNETSEKDESDEGHDVEKGEAPPAKNSETPNGVDDDKSKHDEKMEPSETKISEEKQETEVQSDAVANNMDDLD